MHAKRSTSFPQTSNETENKSPKGHWLLTWVQWALLLKVRTANQKAWLPYLWNQSEQQQSWYFNSGYGDAFGLLLLHSDLKKKSFGEKAPHWLIYCTYCHVCIKNLVCNHVPCLVNAVDFLLYKLHVFRRAVSSYLSSLHTLELHIQVHQLCTNNKHNTYMTQPLGGFGRKV